MPAPPSLTVRSPLGVAYAWGAGAAFVASLGYFAYTYAVTLAAAVPHGTVGSTVAAALFDTLLFGAFALHHSLFARTRTKRWVTRHIPAALERATFVWVASLLLALVCVAWVPIGGTLYRQTGWLAWPHWAVVAAGVLVTALAARRLRPLELAGIDQARHDPRHPRRDPLVVSWPYSLVRHPIYLGWVLVVFGVPHMTANRLLLACLSTTYLVVAIPLEERLLVRTFGSTYQRYRDRVRWRMLPGLY